MEYYVAIGNQQSGPIAYEAMATAGITPDTLVWASGWPTWRPASQVPELAPILRGATPPPIPAQVTLGGVTAPPPIPVQVPQAAPQPAARAPQPGGGNAMFRGVKVPGTASPTAPVSRVTSQPVQQPSQPAQPSQPVQAGNTGVVPATDTSATTSASTTSSDDTKEEGTYKPSLTYSWMWQSIVLTILCCLPVGAVSIYFSMQTKKAEEAGDTELAKELSKKTQLWLKIGLIAGGVFWTIMTYFAWLADAA